MKPAQRGRGRNASSLLQFGRFVSEAKQARRYLVSGLVQGVGYRYFTQDAAERLHVSGFVRNLRDGRVEAFVMATPQQHAEFRAQLQRGPRFASVSELQEEPSTLDPRYEGGFFIIPTD
jgi:acylphosphatase